MIKKTDEIWYGVVGTVFFHRSKEELAEILRIHGINISIGHWILWFPDFSENFELAYEGNIDPESPFVVKADGNDLLALTEVAEIVARALKLANINYEFTVCDHEKDIMEIEV